MRTTWVVALLGVGGVLGACADDPDLFTEQDRALIRAMQLQGTPTDLGNEFANRTDVAALGQMLFFDERLSGDGALPDGGTQVACVDCHAPPAAFADPRKTSVSMGVAGSTTRNAPPLTNVGFFHEYAWDGRTLRLWEQVHFAYTSLTTMAGTPQHLVSAARATYGEPYRLAFGTELPDVSGPDFAPCAGQADLMPCNPELRNSLLRHYGNLLKAIAAYLLRLQSANAPIDRYAAGDETALTEAQKRGLRLFLGEAGCVTCHRGARFTDESYYALGVPQQGENVPTTDPGRAGAAKAAMTSPFLPLMLPTDAGSLDAGASLVGLFRTASLRNVALTAPYFHAGQAATLKDVVWFYNHGGDHQGPNVTALMVPLGLTDAQQEDLVEFLGALTGDPVPASLACNNGDGGSTREPRCGGGR